jgi:predicted nucleic acid-binding protein
VEIKPLEKEVLEYLPQIGPEHELELHDKIIYASACQLRCTLVSSDIKIINANKHVKFVPQIIF